MSCSLSAPYLTKCPSRDSGALNPCALENARIAVAFLGSKGDEKYGFSPIDPIYFPFIETESNGLKIKFTNLKISTDPPMSYAVDDINVDLDRHLLEFNYSAPAVVLNSEYEIDGHVLILPLKGKGDAEIRIDGYDAYYASYFDIVTNVKDHLDYVHLKNTSYDCMVSKVTYNMTNLFNGDESLANATIDFLNANWEDVFAETKGSTFEEIMKFLTAQIQNLFNIVPYQDAFPQ